MRHLQDFDQPTPGVGVVGRAAFQRRWYRAAFLATLRCIAALLVLTWSAGVARAQSASVDSQFDILGFIEEASVDACADALCGGRVVVGGQAIVIPANTIVILPANALTWKELFIQAPAPYTNVATGMALADRPTPLTTFEARVVGNQVNGTFVAALVYISQQATNRGAGAINHIDYAAGEMHVGGRVNRDAAGAPQNVLDPVNPGTRVRLNDPAGAYGRAMSPDKRFTLDADNPTVRTVTGFPMCLPRVDPTAQTPDAACPQGNRPKDGAGIFATTYTMSPKESLAPGQLPDPRIMAPFEVGDFVTYSGTLVSDGGTSGPLSSTASTYISAHTMIANLAFFTTPGSDPSYVAIDVSIIGNGGVIIPGNLEAVVRTRFEGMSTDPSRDIQLFGVDYGTDGKPSDRMWGIVSVDPGPPVGAVKGRWRFRPPCTGVTATFRFCFGPLDETTFLPAPREVRAAIGGTWVTPRTTREVNGLIAGQYHAPIGDYLFQENVPGVAPPPINLATVPFLAGGYSSSTGIVAGPLKPWPASAAPAACTGPVASAGSNITVASGTANVTLNGSATGTGTLTYAWTPPAGVTLAPSNNVANPTFTAPTVTAANTYLFSLSVSGCNGQSATSTMTVTVTPSASATPVIAPIASRTVQSNTSVTLTAVGSGSKPLNYTWAQSSGPAQPFKQAANSATMQVAHVLTRNQVTNDVLVYTVTAKDPATGAVSPPVSVTLTYTPIPDNETVTVAQYRIGKQRLDLTVVSSVTTNPNMVLTLAPYTTTGGAVYDPKGLGNTFTSTGAGTYTLFLIGAPQPGGNITVNSNIGGTTGPFSLLSIRP